MYFFIIIQWSIKTANNTKKISHYIPDEKSILLLVK